MAELWNGSVWSSSVPGIQTMSCIRLVPSPMTSTTGAAATSSLAWKRRMERQFCHHKELDLTEGRNTGFPKIYRSMRTNGSPMPLFETDAENRYFMATLPIHSAFLKDSDHNEPINEPEVIQNGPEVIQNGPEVIQKEGVNEPINELEVIQKKGVNEPINETSVKQNEGVNKPEVIQNDPEVIQNDSKSASFPTNNSRILDSSILDEESNLVEALKALLIEHPKITRARIANELSISERKARKIIDALRSAGLLERKGSDRDGKWVIIAN